MTTRFWFVLLAVAAIVGLTLARMYALALGLGLALGAVLYLRGLALGGGVGNLRMRGEKTADVSSRIGVCLAAAGIAATAIGHDPPFPLPFRVFYLVCQGVACVGALILAARAGRGGPDNPAAPKNAARKK